MARPCLFAVQLSLTTPLGVQYVLQSCGLLWDVRPVDPIDMSTLSHQGVLYDWTHGTRSTHFQPG